MKLFVCLCVLFSVANATFFGLGGGLGSVLGGGFGQQQNQGHIRASQHSFGHGQGHGHGHGQGHGQGNGNGGQAQVFKVKVIRQESSQTGGARGPIQHVPSPSYGPPSGHTQSAAPQVIRVIHQQSEASSIGSSLGPVSAPAQVIRVIHENSAGNSGSAAFNNAPTKVIHVIHEQAPAQSGAQTASFPNVAAFTPDNSNYLPPLQTPVQAPVQASVQVPVQAPVQLPVQAPAQNANTLVPQYSAPSQNIAPSNQYIPPQPQYTPPPTTFTAPEPVPAASHFPAQSYGPPTL